MAATNEIQIAKQKLQLITRATNISQIVYVDDFFEARFDVEVVIAWLNGVPEHQTADLQKTLPGINLDTPFEVWTHDLRVFWEGLPPERQREVALSISAIIGTRFSQDYQVVTRLSDYFPRKIAPHTLSPSEWIQQRDHILETATPESKVLCIFDQDLSEAAGFQSNGSRSGIGLLKDLIDQGKTESVVCCLLTHTITSLENEMTAWRALAQENELNLYQFLPLAKIRLSDNESPLLFADGIKKSILNLYCEKWKQAAVQVINTSTQKAISKIMDVDVYDFDYMIFQISLKEGIWEIESLIRLFQIFHRDEIRELVLDSQISNEFNTLIKNSRPISGIEIDQKLCHHTPKVRPIRRKELYEASSLIRHTPIELGDIFVSSKKQSTFIMLGQPCDLMVRSIGKYAGKRTNDHLSVPILPFRRITAEECKNKPPHHWKTHALLRYFYEDSNDVVELAFSEAEWIEVTILDLSVLDPDGKCCINLNHIPLIPDICTIGWKTRLEGIITHFLDDNNRLISIHNHVKRIRNQQTKNLVQNALIFSQAYSKGIFDFGLQRIARFRHPGSDQLLKIFTQYLSRDAEEVDYAEDV